MHPMKSILAIVGLVIMSGCASDQPAGEGVAATLATDQQAGMTAPLADVGLAKSSRLEAAARERRDPSAIAEAGALAAPGRALPMSPSPVMATVPLQDNREVYGAIDDNRVRRVVEDPLSTFSIDVDSGAYAVIRRYLNQGQLPPTDAVRIEEMINYFDYAYAPPRDEGQPFTVHSEILPTPWREHSHLVRIGIQGYRPEVGQRAPANLVFLVDVSGSMNAPDKLPLLRNALRLLVEQLDHNDRVTLVVYAGSSGVVLETTPGDRRGDILAALDRLSAGGSTHGSAGIRLAYQMAQQAFIDDGINRVILATDGDFNVGTVDHDALVELIERNRERGIALTTLGFGRGNYNDHLMEQLADHGDGNYAYIDSFREARKVLVEQINGTLQTIARDVKIQVEWNPATVAEYRLIGYENRLLEREDFNNDKVDAGDIGAGHNVTALYEITLVDAKSRRIDNLRYATSNDTARSDVNNELALLKLRYKKPRQAASIMMQRVLLKSDIKPDHDSASSHLRFAAAVAAFGEQLRGGQNLGLFGYPDILQLAREGRGDDPHGYRAEFVGLVELAAALDQRG